jgi:hypothetical protein
VDVTLWKEATMSEEHYPEIQEMADEYGVSYDEMLAGLRQAAQNWENSLPWYIKLRLNIMHWIKSR